MVEIGYALSSEEQTPLELVRLARRAEEVGFSFALISDHYHPWTDRQGQSPFVWAVIGGIACQTERLTLGTGVTCPTFRTHPAIIAQAAATAAAMMPGRFFLGVGSGENLNEHILGDHWPPADVRLAMLEEAIEVIRLLWQGGYVSYYGQFFTVEKGGTIKGCGNTLRAVYPSSWHKTQGLKPEGGGAPPWGSVPKWRPVRHLPPGRRWGIG